MTAVSGDVYAGIQGWLRLSERVRKSFTTRGLCLLVFSCI